jgi:hypothetical protein
MAWPFNPFRRPPPAPIVVDQNGERVEYRPSSLAKLAAYIGDLQSEIAGTTRPATVTFQTSKGVN